MFDFYLSWCYFGGARYFFINKNLKWDNEAVMSITIKNPIGAKTVAKLTGWDLQKIYRLTRENRIPHTLIDGRPVYQRHEILGIADPTATAPEPEIA